MDQMKKPGKGRGRPVQVPKIQCEVLMLVNGEERPVHNLRISEGMIKLLAEIYTPMMKNTPDNA
ncbi:MAG: hypothetical protein VB111_04290 [Clostridiaceae bacterium]|nr:hypothetical protein [Clostridiaceae bacterium]